MTAGASSSGFISRMPRWLRVVLILGVLLIVVGLVVPYFLDVDRYRTSIAIAIESATGRKASVGKIRARILPRVGFVVEDFHLSNPPGFAQGDVLSIAKIHGNLAVFPLLGGNIQLSSVDLVEPKLTLLEDDRGETNYSFGEKPSGKAKAAKSVSSSSAFKLSEVDSVDLSNAQVLLGRVTGRNRSVLPTLEAKRINANLSHVAIDPPDLSRWEGEAPLSGVALELPGSKQPIEFRSGRLTLKGGKIDSDFRIRLGKAGEFKGTLRVDNVENAVAKFDLSTNELDVDHLLALSGESPAPATPRPRPAKSELIAQGKLAAERIQWQPYRANNGRAEVRVFTDRIELWPVAVELYGGSLQVSARADRTQVPERFSANIEMRGLDVGKMLSVASPGLRGKMTGTGEMDLQLFGSMGPNFAKALTGTGRFAIRDGRLPGFNVPSGLEALAKLGGGTETPFSVIQGDLNIANARVASKQIHMDSPRGTLDLRGSSGFDSTLDYDGQANVDLAGALTGGSKNPVSGAIGGILGGVMKQRVGTTGRVTVTFTVRGTFSDPKIYPSGGMVTTQGQASPSQPAQKKSILDLFKKP